MTKDMEKIGTLSGVFALVSISTLRSQAQASKILVYNGRVCWSER